jgi:hypothetical protein
VDEETEAPDIRAIKANVWDFVLAGATFFKGVANAMVEGWQVIEVTAIAASAERMERARFERDAVRDIEEITRGGEYDR